MMRPGGDNRWTAMAGVHGRSVRVRWIAPCHVRLVIARMLQLDTTAIGAGYIPAKSSRHRCCASQHPDGYRNALY